MRQIYFYPVFQDKAEWDDVVCRSAWYYTPWTDSFGNMSMACSFSSNEPVQLDDRLDFALQDKVPSLIPKLNVFQGVADGDRGFDERVADDADLLLVWKMPEDAQGRDRVDSMIDQVRARGGLAYVVDKDREMSHGCHWLWSSITLATPEDRREMFAESYEKLKRFAEGVKKPRCYVVGTGPNLEQAAGRDFSDGECIIANSVIKNRELMDRLRPRAVVACDPIFHAGCSQYAAEFRSTLIEALDDYPELYFFAPHRDQKVYLANFPPRLHNRMIFIPIDTDPAAAWNCDLLNDFYFVPEGNVLTQMMLPLAGAFYKTVSIIGCDGRPLSENKYFWKHHAGSQFNDKMQNIQEVHPAFFSLRDYDDHYEEHCADVSRIIGELEQRGLRVESLTDSYVPALCKRTALDWKTLDNVEFVSVNPNLKNVYGHLAAYDDGLQQAVEAAGGRFRALASREAANGSGLSGRDGVEYVFTDNVYTSLTRFLPEVDQAAVLNFERELEGAVQRHLAEAPDRHWVYYLYMGSLPHAVAMANVCARHPQIFATINTFGECIMDCERDGHIDAWGPFLRSLDGQKNIEVLAITKQIKRIVQDRCGANLLLAPHPSSTFADSDCSARLRGLLAQPRERSEKRLLFAGGFWAEKGFDLTCDIARLASRLGFECTVRTGPLESADSAQMRAREELLHYARTADGILDAEQYVGLFADADIAVLPYRQCDWVNRNSSVVIDCLYSGLPMVVIDGTWLADIVREYGAGEVVAEESAGAYLAAVEKIQENYAAYRRSTAAGAHAYFSGNSFGDMVSSALAPYWALGNEESHPYDPATAPGVLDKLREAAIGGDARDAAPGGARHINGSPAPHGAGAENGLAERQGAVSMGHSLETPAETLPLEFEFSREADCMMEELGIVQALFRRWNTDPANAVMIDVGAHSGGSFPPFLDDGWRVYGFEPDPSNRAGIPERYRNHPRFTIDPRALSDKIEHDVPFFASPESTGISTLSGFRDTHAETARVSTVTLGAVLREYQIDHVNLLKVDTEGFDLFVLRGMDFSLAKPDVIITEFENNKTERLGYTFEDQIALLEAQGYTVFVSEWWPIVRYGIRHHWRSIYPASHRHPRPESWGNFIAFKTPPSYREVYETLLEAVNMPHEPDHIPVAEQAVETLKARIAGVDPDARPLPPAAPAPAAEPAARSAQRPPVVKPRTITGPLLPRTTPNTSGAMANMKPLPRRSRAKRAVMAGAALTFFGELALIAAFALALDPESLLFPVRGALAGLAAAGAAALIVGAPLAAAFRKRAAIAARLNRRHPVFWSLIRSAANLLRRRFKALAAAGLFTGGLVGLTAALIGQAAFGLAPLWIGVTAAAVAGTVGIVFLIGASSLLMVNFVQATLSTQAGQLRRVEDRLSDAANHSFVRRRDFEDLNASLRSRMAGVDGYLEELRAVVNRRVDREADVGRELDALKAQSQSRGAEIERLSGSVDDRLAQISTAVDDRLAQIRLSDIEALKARSDASRAEMERLAASVSEEVEARLYRVTDRLLRSQKQLERRQAAQQSGFEKRISQVDGVLSGVSENAERAIEKLGAELRGDAAELRSHTEKAISGLASELHDKHAQVTRWFTEDHEILKRQVDALAELDSRLIDLRRAQEARLEGLEVARIDDNRTFQELRNETDRLHEGVEALRGRAAVQGDKLRDTLASMSGDVAETRESLSQAIASMSGDVAEARESLSQAVGELTARLEELGQSRDADHEAVATMRERAAKLQAEVDSLRGRASVQGDKMRASLEAAAADGAKALEAVEKLSARTDEESQALARFQDELYKISMLQHNSRAELLEEALAATREEIARLSEEQGQRIQDGVNTALAAAGDEAGDHIPLSSYLNFNRTLSEESVGKLLGWAKELNVSVNKQAILYMAHRVEQIENMCAGRLATSIESQLLRMMVAKAVNRKSISLLEIGTLYGIGGGAIADTVREDFNTVDFTVVDPFEGYYGSDARDPITGTRVTRSTFENNARRIMLPEDHVHIIQGFSEEDDIIRAAAERQYDYLLIDGDHSYDGVRRDFENYAPMVRRYGFILIDDYMNDEYDGINKFVDRELASRNDLRFIGHDWHTAVFRVWKKID